MKFHHESPDAAGRRKEALAKTLEGDIIFDGVTYQADKASRDAIQAQALNLQLNPDMYTVYWRSKDNEMVVLTRDQFLELFKAVTTWSESVRRLYWGLS